MGKVSPKEKMSKTSKQKRRNHGSNKYLKPGALAQLRNSKASASKSSTDISKNSVDVMDEEKTHRAPLFQSKHANDTPIILSPEKFRYNVAGPVDLLKENNLQRTPKTPRPEGNASDYDSRLESLPMELLVTTFSYLLRLFL